MTFPNSCEAAPSCSNERRATATGFGFRSRLLVRARPPRFDASVQRARRNSKARRRPVACTGNNGMTLEDAIAALYVSEINCGCKTFWDGGIEVWVVTASTTTRPKSCCPASAWRGGTVVCSTRRRGCIRGRFRSAAGSAQSPPAIMCGRRATAWAICSRSTARPGTAGPEQDALYLGERDTGMTIWLD
ncbi:MAG: hypothetical protein QOJ15_9252 [Bradyrhizobium sp.]|nr:hypothetical protein [Bradyrhizobium sp.]